MRLYRTAKGAFAGTQADARKDGPGWNEVDVPTTKPELLAFLNDNLPAPQLADEPHHPAFAQGYHDAVNGRTTNPYGVPETRDKWIAGYDFADENGRALLPRFGKIAQKRGR